MLLGQWIKRHPTGILKAILTCLILQTSSKRQRAGLVCKRVRFSDAEHYP
jgi:hypothetical protein